MTSSQNIPKFFPSNSRADSFMDEESQGDSAKSMTRYRIRAVLLLFLVLNLTACYMWQGVAIPSPAQFIEATQPDRVRVVVRGEGEVELANPSVEGDQLVGAGDFSMPLADILGLEVHGFSLGRTALLVVGGVVALPVILAISLVAGCGTGSCL